MRHPVSPARACALTALALATAPAWCQVGYSRSWSGAPAAPLPPDVTVVVPPVKVVPPVGMPNEKMLREQVEKARALSMAGAAQSMDLSELAGALSLSDAAGPDGERNAALQRDVDIQLKNAPIRQVADALSRASGVKIAVSDSVSKDQRVNLEARRVPLASVLEAVARQTNLIISPEKEGVSLGPMPSLTVNGDSRKFTVRRPPWSDDWLIPPTSHAFGGAIFGGGGFGGGTSTGSAPMAWTFGSSGQAGLPGSDRYSLAAVGDRVVVAEPGTNDDGEAGVWLTVYRLDGDDLVQVSQKFQKGRGAGIVKRTLKVGSRSVEPVQDPTDSK